MQKTALRQHGFTLIELLIVISVISIITLALIPNFNSYIETQNVKQSQEHVKSDLRSAQNNALSGFGADEQNTDYFWGVGFVAYQNNYVTKQYERCSVAPCDESISGSNYNVIRSQTSETLPGGVEIKSNVTVLFNEKGYAIDTCSSDCTVIVGDPSDNTCAGVIINDLGLVKKQSIACP